MVSPMSTTQHGRSASGILTMQKRAVAQVRLPPVPFAAPLPCLYFLAYFPLTLLACAAWSSIPSTHTDANSNAFSPSNSFPAPKQQQQQSGPLPRLGHSQSQQLGSCTPPGTPVGGGAPLRNRAQLHDQILRSSAPAPVSRRAPSGNAALSGPLHTTRAGSRHPADQHHKRQLQAHSTFT